MLREGILAVIDDNFDDNLHQSRAVKFDASTAKSISEMHGADRSSDIFGCASPPASGKFGHYVGGYEGGGVTRPLRHVARP